MQARREKDAEAVKMHEKLMAFRKKNFESLFRNVWGYSVSGVSYFTVDIEPKEEGGKDWTSIEDTIWKLFNHTLISDVRDFVDVKRWYKNDIDYGSTNTNTQMKSQMKRRLSGLTSDDRVAELIEEVIDIQQREEIDILVYQVSDISNEYKNWTVVQTEDLDKSHDFSDQDPFANSTPISDDHSHESMVDFEKKTVVNKAPVG